MTQPEISTLLETGSFNFALTGAHILLAECQDEVDFAGEAFFSHDGELLWWDNFSGAFQPSPKLSHQIEFFPEDIFIDRSGTAETKSSGPAPNRNIDANQAAIAEEKSKIPTPNKSVEENRTAILKF
jgi:hypothetical protein